MQGVLRDGTQVAIKSLSLESKQGTKEFMTEIDMISNIQHPNLVQLIGCCVEGNHRILVYEFLKNNSLASSLLGKYQNSLKNAYSSVSFIWVGCYSTFQLLKMVHLHYLMKLLMLCQNLGGGTLPKDRPLIKVEPPRL